MRRHSWKQGLCKTVPFRMLSLRKLQEGTPKRKAMAAGIGEQQREKRSTTRKADILIKREVVLCHSISSWDSDWATVRTRIGESLKKFAVLGLIRSRPKLTLARYHFFILQWAHPFSVAFILHLGAPLPTSLSIGAWPFTDWPARTALGKE